MNGNVKENQEVSFDKNASAASKELEVLRSAAAYLAAKPKVSYNPWPIYPDVVMEALHTLPADYDYLEHHDLLENKPIASMNLDDIATMYTFIQRGERFCDGHIAGFIEDGTLYMLIQRHMELLL